MKKNLLFVFVMISIGFAGINVCGLDESITNYPTWDSLKQRVDFHYYNTLTVSKMGAMFNSIKSAIDFAMAARYDTVNILIYGSMPTETICIDSFFVRISIMGMNSAANNEIGNTVFILNHENLSILFQNLAFNKVHNKKNITYFGFFHNMIDSLVSDSSANVVFSDIFGSEVVSYFNWPSGGYLAFSQGKYMGNSFTGVISNVFNTNLDTLIFFGYDNVRQFYWTNGYTYMRYATITGYLNVHNQLTVLDGIHQGYFKPTELFLAGNIKSRHDSDSLYYTSSDGSGGVTGSWRVADTLYAGTIVADGSKNFYSMNWFVKNIEKTVPLKWENIGFETQESQLFSDSSYEWPVKNDKTKIVIANKGVYQFNVKADCYYNGNTSDKNILIGFKLQKNGDETAGGNFAESYSAENGCYKTIQYSGNIFFEKGDTVSLMYYTDSPNVQFKTNSIFGKPSAINISLLKY